MTESINTVDLMQHYTRCTYVQDVRVRCRTPIIPNLVNVATFTHCAACLYAAERCKKI